MRLCFCQPDHSLCCDAYLAYASKRQGPYSRYMHMHPDTVEVILITDGTGEYFIGNRSYPVNAGDLVIYNSRVVHDEYLEEGSTICCGIRKLVRPGLRPDALLPDSVMPIFPLHHHYDNVFLLMNAIFMMLNSAAEHRQEMAQEMTRVLLNYIDNNVLLMQTPSPPPEKQNRPLQDFTLPASVKMFIDDNFHEPIRLEALAQKFRVSPFYISHEFKKRYGYSPMDYLLKRRLGEAQTLLTTADEQGTLDSITNIAYQVGFSNLSHFQSYFKNKVGKTPGQYRNEYLQANYRLLKGY